MEDVLNLPPSSLPSIDHSDELHVYASRVDFPIEIYLTFLEEEDLELGNTHLLLLRVGHYDNIEEERFYIHSTLPFLPNLPTYGNFIVFRYREDERAFISITKPKITFLHKVFDLAERKQLYGKMFSLILVNDTYSSVYNRRYAYYRKISLFINSDWNSLIRRSSDGCILFARVKYIREDPRIDDPKYLKEHLQWRKMSNTDLLNSFQNAT